MCVLVIFPVFFRRLTCLSRVHYCISKFEWEFFLVGHGACARQKQCLWFVRFALCVCASARVASFPRRLLVAFLSVCHLPAGSANFVVVWMGSLPPASLCGLMVEG